MIFLYMLSENLWKIYNMNERPLTRSLLWHLLNRCEWQYNYLRNNVNCRWWHNLLWQEIDFISMIKRADPVIFICWNFLRIAWIFTKGIVIHFEQWMIVIKTPLDNNGNVKVIIKSHLLKMRSTHWCLWVVIMKNSFYSHVRKICLLFLNQKWKRNIAQHWHINEFENYSGLHTFIIML